VVKLFDFELLKSAGLTIGLHQPGNLMLLHTVGKIVGNTSLLWGTF